MKNRKILTAKLAKMLAENALRRDANSTTCAAIYQPKVPAKLCGFKKEQK